MSTTSQLTAFPASGYHSICGGMPQNAGTVQVTEIRNLIDDRWSSAALSRAAAMGGVSGGCMGANGLWNPSGTALGMGGGAGLSLAGVGGVLDACAESIDETIADLQIACSLQSLAAGLANSVSEIAASLSSVLDSAIGAVEGAVGEAVRTANQLLDVAGRAVDLFSGAVQLASRGLMAIENLDPGELISGGLAKLRDMAGAEIDKAIDKAAALLDRADALATDLINKGINAVMAPLAKLNEIANMFAPVVGKISRLAGGVRDALANLNMDALSRIAGSIGQALAKVLGDMTGAIASMATALANGAINTIDRLQGLVFIDGEWGYTFPISRFSAVGMNSAWSKMRTWRLDVGRYGSSSSAAARVLVAALLGSSPPVRGSFLATTLGGWLGSPSAAAHGMAAALSEACAFNAAMRSAISSFASAGAHAIDSLMAALECRRSAYSKIAAEASAAQRDSNALLQRLLGVRLVISGGAYPPKCSASSLVLGSCL